VEDQRKQTTAALVERDAVEVEEVVEEEDIYDCEEKRI
jgi:hypothetical protein